MRQAHLHQLMECPLVLPHRKHRDKDNMNLRMERKAEAVLRMIEEMAPMEELTLLMYIRLCDHQPLQHKWLHRQHFRMSRELNRKKDQESHQICDAQTAGFL